MAFRTADLYDAHEDEVACAESLLASYGGVRVFSGPIATVKTYEDNSLVREALGEAGLGRVLVVDGGGSRRRALVGDVLAGLAVDKGWSGIVLWGCVRDGPEIGRLAIGCLALGTQPARSAKRGQGVRDVPVSFAGVTFMPGHHVYVDPDGLLVAPRALL